MFNILAMQELAQLLENNSKLFQSSTLTAEQALTSIDKLYIRLQELRSDEEFQRLFTKISGLAGVKSLEVARAAKRKRVTPRGTSDFVAHSQAPIESTDIGERNALQANFYEAIDATSQAIKDRFDQEDLKKLMKINKCLIGAANKESSKEDAKDELACISDLIDLDTLKEELQELPIYIKIYNKEVAIPIRKITKIDTICEIMSSKECHKECLPELHKILQLYNSVALSSATAERTFSTIRRIKTWLRSNMTANFLSNKMFANLHKERMDTINIEKIAGGFIKRSERRKKYFGRF